MLVTDAKSCAKFLAKRPPDHIGTNFHLRDSDADGQLWATDQRDILFRGPWVINKAVLDRIILLTLFSRRVYISAYVGVSRNDPDLRHIWKWLLHLSEIGKLEAYSLQYLNYFHNMGRENRDLLYLSELTNPRNVGKELSAIEPKFAFWQGKSNVTKIYGLHQTVVFEVPISATAEDLKNPAFIECLLGLRRHVSQIRTCDTDCRLYAKLWPRYCRHIRACVDQSLDCEWALPFKAAMARVPITLIDLAYYINLTSLLLTYFQDCSVAMSRHEAPLWNAKMGLNGFAADNSMAHGATLAHEYFEFPRFRRLSELSEARYSAMLTDERVALVAEWVRQVRASDQGNVHKSINEMIDKEALKQAPSTLQRNYLKKGAISLVAKIWPLAAVAPFARDLADFYRNTYRRPVIGLTLDMLN